MAFCSQNKSPEGRKDSVDKFLENEFSPPKIRKLNTGDIEVSTSGSESSLERKSPTTQISSVTLYTSNIKIHGVVTRKGELGFSRVKNIKFIDFEVADIEGNRIKIVGFENEAEIIESDVFENESYFITGVEAQEANEKFNDTGHCCQLKARSDFYIEQSADLIPMPKLTIERKGICDIGSHINDFIDVLAIVEKISDLMITEKNGMKKTRREMELIDETATIVRFTVWDSEAENLNPTDYLHRVLAFKNVKPHKFRGALCLKTTFKTSIYCEPNFPEVPVLLDWYEKERPEMEVCVLSEISPQKNNAIITISETYGTDSPQYFILNAMITRIESKLMYKGCSSSSEKCSKKVVEVDEGYFCEKCNKSSSTFQWLYLMRIELSDWTGQIDVTAFNKAATEIVGKSAQELGDLSEIDEQQYNAILQRLYFKKKQWKIRSKTEESGKQFIVVSVQEVENDNIMKTLRELIQQLEHL